MSNLVIIEKEFRFEASHVLPKHPGKCSRLHGHSWVLRVGVKGTIDPETGFVMDYSELKKCVDSNITDRLDHSHLGYGGSYTRAQIDANEDYIAIDKYQIPFGYSFYPSSENLVVAIAKILQPLIPEIKSNVRLYSVALDETCTSRATFYA